MFDLFKILQSDNFDKGSIEIIIKSITGRTVGKLTYLSRPNRIETTEVYTNHNEDKIRNLMLNALLSCLRRHDVEIVQIILKTAIFTSLPEEIAEIKNTDYYTSAGFILKEKAYSSDWFSLFEFVL